jgi:hypothetical protein
MSLDSIIMGWDIGEKCVCVCGYSLIKLVDICGGETRLAMLTHRLAVLGPGKLGGILQCLLDAVGGCPSKIGA